MWGQVFFLVAKLPFGGAHVPHRGTRVPCLPPAPSPASYSHRPWEAAVTAQVIRLLPPLREAWIGFLALKFDPQTPNVVEM